MQLVKNKWNKLVSSGKVSMLYRDDREERKFLEKVLRDVCAQISANEKFFKWIMWVRELFPSIIEWIKFESKVNTRVTKASKYPMEILR